MDSKRTLFCFIVVSSVLVLSEGLPTSHHLYHRLQKRSYMKLCGRMLVEALAAVCQSQYYGPFFKRNNEEYVSDNDQKWDEDSANPDGILDPQSALDFFGMNQITRRGVADECCVKSCSLHQLISYCGTKSSKK